MKVIHCINENNEFDLVHSKIDITLLMKFI